MQNRNKYAIMCCIAVSVFLGTDAKATEVDSSSYQHETKENETYTMDKKGYGWYQNGSQTYYRLLNGQNAVGGYEIDGNVYYFNQYGILQRNLVRKIGSVTYYYNEDGIRVTDKWITIKGKRCYFKKDGTMAKGLTSINGNTYYFYQDGKVLRNNWVKRNNKKYYFGNDGKMKLDKGFFTIGDKTYYITCDGSVAIGGYKVGKQSYFFDEIGVMKKDYVRRVGSSIYYYDESGVRVQNKWMTLEGKRCYFMQNGAMAKGLIKINDDSYYFASSGTVLRNSWIKRSGDRYYFGNDGKMIKETGFLNLKAGTYYITKNSTTAQGGYKINKATYYFNELGIMMKSFLRNDGENSYYYDESGKRVENKWMTLDKRRIYFKNNGQMAKGLTGIRDAFYYFYFNGDVLRNNWIQRSQLRYYFGNDGKMLIDKGFTKIKNDTYYVNSTGAMAVGELKIQCNTYFFDSIGKMKKNFLRETSDAEYYYGDDGIRYENKWMTLGKKRVYFKQDGKMAIGKVAVNSKDTYYFDETGNVKKDYWLTLKGNRYYFQTNGKMVKTAIRMNGTIYNFDKNGVFLSISSSGWVMENGEKKLYNSVGKLVTGARKFVIDISSHNGAINWQAVKDSGVDYVILRCGYGYTDDDSQVDSKFLENALELERLGIPYGVYLFSYGSDVQDAKGEANYVLNIIKGRKISLPVYYDLEYSNYVGHLSAKTYTEMAINFCEQIKAAGYTPGIYANRNYWENKLYDQRLNKYSKWVAEYAYADEYYIGENHYKGNYDVWQYTSSGRVPGINGRVDLNAWYI